MFHSFSEPALFFLAELFLVVALVFFGLFGSGFFRRGVFLSFSVDDGSYCFLGGGVAGAEVSFRMGYAEAVGVAGFYV